MPAEKYLRYFWVDFMPNFSLTRFFYAGFTATNKHYNDFGFSPLLNQSILNATQQSTHPFSHIWMEKRTEKLKSLAQPTNKVTGDAQV